MPLLRRLGAALSTVFLLQLTLLGSGTLCATGGGMGEMRAMADGHGGHLGPSVSPAEATPADAPMNTPCDAAGGDGGCRLPWAGGSCTSMMSCTVAVVPSVPAAAHTIASRSAAVRSEPASIHSLATAAPELPPPRA